MQVLLPAGSSPPLIAELPAALRTAESARTVAGIHRIFIVSPDPEFIERWREPAARVDGVELLLAKPQGMREAIRERLLPEPVLVLSDLGIPEPSALSEMSVKREDMVSWSWEGQSVAAAYPGPDEFLSAFASTLAAHDPLGAERSELPPDAWQPLRNEQERTQAEVHLFESLRKSNDGYFASLDRSVSIALSRRLIRTRLTPNQITTASLVLGLVGAASLAFAGYWGRVAGALALCAACILDGCDGEVARLKLSCSPSGAFYDLIADHIGNLAIFVGVIVALCRLRPGTAWMPLAVVLLSGVFLSMLIVWRVILKPVRGNALPIAFEKVASRDFTYLLLIFVVIQRLHWFAWSAAVGSHAFWLSLWFYERSTATTKAPA